MNANDVINITKDHASEWLEMHDNPDQFLCTVLANQIVKLVDHIEYLERRVANAS